MDVIELTEDGVETLTKIEEECYWSAPQVLRRGRVDPGIGPLCATYTTIITAAGPHVEVRYFWRDEVNGGCGLEILRDQIAATPGRDIATYVRQGLAQLLKGWHREIEAAIDVLED